MISSCKGQRKTPFEIAASDLSFLLPSIKISLFVRHKIQILNLLTPQKLLVSNFQTNNEGSPNHRYSCDDCLRPRTGWRMRQGCLRHRFRNSRLRGTMWRQWCWRHRFGICCKFSLFYAWVGVIICNCQILVWIWVLGQMRG